MASSMHRCSVLLVLLIVSPAFLHALRQVPRNAAARKAVLAAPSMDYWLDEPMCNQNSPSTLLPPGMPIRDDTIGSLIANQMFWRLPGIDNFAHGFNVFTGTTQIYPIFQFCYPENSTETMRVQDTYRGNVYELPHEVYASALPQCTFSMTSKTYSSAQEMAYSMAESSGVAASVGAKGKAFGFSGSLSFSFSLDQSVTQAEQLQTTAGGTLVKTSVECLTSAVQLDKDITSFHPSFVQALYNAQDSADMSTLMDNYGTHYFVSGQLGGKLTSITSVSSSYASRNSEASLSEHAQASFSASASGWGNSASASASGTYSTDQQRQSFQEFQQASTSSYILSYGGAPGTFGPTNPEDPANWGSWAQTVDLLPIPINYKVARIYDIIPKTWKNANGDFVYQLWEQGEQLYYVNQATNILKRQLGADNVYKITVSTGSATRTTGNGASMIVPGPYGFRINSFTPPNPGYTTPPEFFYKQVALNTSSPSGAPFATWPYIFRPQENFTTVIRQIDMGPLTNLSMCTASSVAPEVLWANAGDFTYLGATRITVEDTLRSKIYPVTDLALLTAKKTGCITLQFATLPDSINIAFELKTPPPNKVVSYVAKLTVTGTSGVFTLLSPVTNIYKPPVMNQTTISFFSKVGYELGVLENLSMDILVVSPIQNGPGQITPWSFTLFAATLRVEYTHSNTIMAYRGLGKGISYVAVGAPLSVNIAPTGLVFDD